MSDNNSDNSPLFSDEDVQRHTDNLNTAQGVIDRMLNDPVLGKMFVKPDFDLPPMPWEVEEVKGEQ